MQIYINRNTQIEILKSVSEFRLIILLKQFCQKGSFLGRETELKLMPIYSAQRIRFRLVAPCPTFNSS